MAKNIKNLKVYTNALAIAFVLTTTTPFISGCQNKPSNTTIEKTIEQNDLYTYAGDILTIEEDLKKDLQKLEQALSKDEDDEQAKNYIVKNSQHILQEYLAMLIKSTMCYENQESIYECNNYIINCEYDKYDPDRITITNNDKVYLIKLGRFEYLIKDLIAIKEIDKDTNYEDIRKIAIKSIEDSKRFISTNEIDNKEVDILTKFFNKDVTNIIETKKRGK
ncbi:MAG: hypothetical protein VZS44_05760 [Bacilli bacterium]|nr:hypothetical protein [Bacilli bacterium]